MFQDAEEARKFIADEDVKFVDVRFCDLPGTMQRFTVPVETFAPDEELAFDGSSIRGFQAIHESDMALRADLRTARLDSFRKDTTPIVNFFIHAPVTGELIKCGILVEKRHHEVGTAGQAAEISYRFNTLLHAADDLQLYKYIVKNVAWRDGRTAAFVPRPIFGDNGSGMHAHQSLGQAGNPPFYDEEGYAGLSESARHNIGGLLKHAPSLPAFANPTVNSYHRLVPGFETPVNLVHSQRNRSACVRIPITSTSSRATSSPPT